MIPGEQYYLRLIAVVLDRAMQFKDNFTFLAFYSSLLDYEFSDVWSMVDICIQSGTFYRSDERYIGVNDKDGVRAFLIALKEKNNEQ